MPAYEIKFDELELDEWDPRTMPDDSCCLMIGARHSGKSVLLTDIMYHKRHRLDMVMGMNPTEEANETLSQFTPPCLIYDEYNDQAIRNLMEWQKRCRAHDKRNKTTAGYKSKTYKVGLVLDDCMGETDAKGKKKKVMQSGDIDRLFKLGRHFKLFFICCMQYIKDAPPTIRGNVDYVFVFDTNSGSEKEKLWKEYFNMFTYKDFLKVLAACVGEKYNCIVLDVRTSRGAPGKGIYYYKAVDRTIKVCKPFKVGRAVFWNLADYYFSDKADIELDPTKIRGVDFAGMVGKKDAKGAPAPMTAKAKAEAKMELVVKRKAPSAPAGVARAPRAAPAPAAPRARETRETDPRGRDGGSGGRDRERERERERERGGDRERERERGGGGDRRGYDRIRA